MFSAGLTKSRSKKGFTLMEMLIVVAIIGVLVSVSFPVFNNQLETARVATDAANVRAAKAVAMATYLTTEIAFSGYYDAAKGIIVENTDEAKLIEPYGQSSKIPESSGERPQLAPKGNIIWLRVDAGVFESEWHQKPKN